MKKIITLCLFCYSAFASQYAMGQSKATFYTSMGTFVVDLYDNLQPITTGNFKSLVNAKFYDGIIFHRVINNFMIQGGDPTGTGAGGPGYTIMDEFDPATSNVQKAIAMANAGPNTGGSQFFINLVNNTYLDPNHPVFGMVSSNFNVVQAIGGVATNASDKPLTDVVMDSIRITAFPTGINETQDTKHLLFEIFPNPATTQSTLSIQSDAGQNVGISVTDIFGTVHHQQQKQLHTGVNRISFQEMNTGNLASGIYFIVVKDKASVYNHKVLLMK